MQEIFFENVVIKYGMLVTKKALRSLMYNREVIHVNFEEIYELYFKDVYLFLLAMSKDDNIAEEITQETFYKALKNIHKFHGACSVKTWLCQIAKNTYLTHLKKQKHLARGEISESIDLQDEGKSESAESIYLRKDETLSIYKVLHYLEEPYKEVFTLRTLGDLSFKEIGEVFERKEGWARVTYHRAKLRIQELIKEV